MPNPANSRFADDGSRFYYDPADTSRVYPSVTSVLGVLNKPALVGWAAKESATFAVENVERLAELCRRGSSERAIREIKGARFSGNASALGSAFHDAVESYILGKPRRSLADNVSPAEVDALLERFFEWENRFKPEWEMTEATVCNPEIGYAGTLDAIAFFPSLGKRLIIDFKTGKSVYPETALQLTAYRRATEVWLADGEKVEFPTDDIDGAAVLHVRPERAIFRAAETGDYSFSVFRALLHVFAWKETPAVMPRITEPVGSITTDDAPTETVADRVVDPFDGEPETVLARMRENGQSATGAPLDPELADAPAPSGSGSVAVDMTGESDETASSEPENAEPVVEPAPAESEPETDARENAVAETRKKQRRKRAENEPTSAEIRAWGIERGLAKPGRGRLSPRLVEMYNREHPERQYVA